MVFFFETVLSRALKGAYFYRKKKVKDRPKKLKDGHYDDINRHTEERYGRTDGVTDRQTDRHRNVRHTNKQTYLNATRFHRLQTAEQESKSRGDRCEKTMANISSGNRRIGLGRASSATASGSAISSTPF
jgi:hypothetical protein